MEEWAEQGSQRQTLVDVGSSCPVDMAAQIKGEGTESREAVH